MKPYALLILCVMVLKASSDYCYDDRGYKQEVYVSNTMTRNGEMVYRFSLHSASIGFVLGDYIIIELKTLANDELIEIYEQQYSIQFVAHPLGNKKICKFRVQNKNVSIEIANEIMESKTVQSSYPDWIMLVK